MSNSNEIKEQFLIEDEITIQQDINRANTATNVKEMISILEQLPETLDLANKTTVRVFNIDKPHNIHASIEEKW